MRRDLDVGFDNGDRRGPLPTKPAYDCVQWLLTHRGHEHVLRTNLALSTILEKVPVRHMYKLKPDRIREYVDRRGQDVNQKRSGKHISQRTIHLEAGSPRSMLNCAVKQQWIRRNPLAGVELMGRPRGGMIDYLAPDEISGLFQHPERAF